MAVAGGMHEAASCGAYSRSGGVSRLPLFSPHFLLHESPSQCHLPSALFPFYLPLTQNKTARLPPRPQFPPITTHSPNHHPSPLPEPSCPFTSRPYAPKNRRLTRPHLFFFLRSLFLLFLRCIVSTCFLAPHTSSLSLDSTSQNCWPSLPHS